jgi:superfamily II DNA or RNA helicase
MARIFDNINSDFTEGLRGIVSNVGVTRTDFCVGYFNLRGWGYISDLIDKLPGETIYEECDNQDHTRYCRLLIGMQKPDEEILQTLYSASKEQPIDSEQVQIAKRKVVQSFRRQLVLGVPTTADEKAIRTLTRQLKERRVVVKLYLKTQLHAKLYLAYRPSDFSNPIQPLMGSSNLTYAGMKGQGELDTEIGDSTNAKILRDWFEDKWNEHFCIDITDELIKVLEECWASDRIISPYYIYLKTAYHLSQEARTSINEYNLTPEFRNQLFEFQQNAVKIAAQNLEKRGGTMIGDVVGLGKTITACAVAKIYEMRHGNNTTILCPANLVGMWETYVKKYDLKADVLSISKRIDVKNARYSRLLIIDESHNLRNPSGKRYKNIKELIEYQGCKVLLLTATPYNKDYRDLSNQLKLFLPEDQDLGIMPEAYIRKIGGIGEYLVRHSEDPVRSIKAFEHSDEAEDWQNLMRMFLVRRTRTFIKTNFAKEDNTNGRKYLEFPNGTKSYFPNRIPKSIKFSVQEGDQFKKLYSEDVIRKIDSLKLPRYALYSQYVDHEKEKQADERDKMVLNDLSRAGETMMGFCRTMFLKRLDSSGVSFLISVYRHILRNAICLYAIENNFPVPIGDDGNIPEEYTDEKDGESVLFDSKTGTIGRKGTHYEFPLELEEYIKRAKEYYQTIGNNVSWISASLFKKRSLELALKKDCVALIDILSVCGTWKSEEDRKLDALETLIKGNHFGEKMIIFTQFSDTAEYVAGQMKLRGVNSISCVTGDTESPESFASRFSPISNGANVEPKDELQILVATDVLSEGQNLQDSHIIINYDLPWAIIRLIQRAGRVDRIGQESDKIYCYSFFPAEGIDEIINLRGRLNQRINENAQVVGSDEIFFEGNKQNLKDLYNEKTGILDDSDDSDVDLASQAFQIWRNAIKEHKELEQIIPNLGNVIYSSKRNAFDKEKEGVITYAKTKDGCDMLTWLRKDGSVVTQSQKIILDSLKCEYDESPVEHLKNHHELVAKAAANIKDTQFSTSGVLGSRFSLKYQLYNRINSFCNDPDNVLFVTDRLKGALDDIYNYPLKDGAKNTLSLMIRHGESTQTIIELVQDFKENDELVVRKEEDETMKTTQIICSMGIVNEE